MTQLSRINLLITIFSVLHYTMAFIQCPSLEIISTNCVFTFNQNINCSFKQCQYDQLSTETAQVIVDDWNTCLNVCCYGLTLSSQPTRNEVQTCKNYMQNTSSSQSFKYAIPATIIAILIIVLACCKMCGCSIHSIKNKLAQTCCCCLNRRQSRQERSRRYISDSLTNVNNNYGDQSIKVIMQTDESKQQINKQNKCPICLDQKTNLTLLPCKHVYHLKCLAEWFNKKMQCAECRTSQISKYRVYCVNCLLYYQQIKYIDLRKEYVCKQCAKQ